MEKKLLRNGYTTGSCAAAGAQAAALAYLRNNTEMVEIVSPKGELIHVPILQSYKTDRGARAVVIKDAGDDPDITNGIEIIVDFVPLETMNNVVIKGGEGVGKVTKPGLSIAVGEFAVNLVPREMIATAVQMVWNGGCEITISIPKGKELAKKTLNPILGIAGGLSIIGTSGIVRPMSEEAFKHSLSPQISVAKAQGYESIVLVPGKIGADAGIDKFSLPKECIVQMSNFVGYMLESAVEQNIKQVLLLGHLGKLVKVAAGNFHTHNRVSDARMETLAAYLGAAGAAPQILQSVLQSTTTEAVMDLIEEHKMQSVYTILAQQASYRAMRYIFNEMTVGTAIVTLKGELLGLDENAKKIGADLGWNIVS